MASNKKITDLSRRLPVDGFNFIVATQDDNFRVTYEDLKKDIAGDIPESNNEIGIDKQVQFYSGEFITGSDCFVYEYQESTLSGCKAILDILTVDSIKGDIGDFDNINLPGIGDVGDVIDKLSSEQDSYVFFSSIENNNGPEFSIFYDTPTPNTKLSGVYVESAESLRATIRWDGPLDSYMGTGHINLAEIPFGDVSEIGENTRRFEGFADGLNLVGTSELTGHMSRGTGYAKLFELGPGPVPEDISIWTIDTATPQAGKLLGTRDLKDGDKINIDVVYDTKKFPYWLQSPKGINIYDQGLARASSHSNLIWWDSALGLNYSGTTIPITVSDRDGGDLGVCLDTFNFADITGSEICSYDFFGNNRTRSADNTTPVISIDEIIYPLGQMALKNQESATIRNTIENADIVEYQGIVGAGTLVDEIILSNNDTYEVSKTATRSAGEYNIDQPNFLITAVRTTNGISTSSVGVVNIAHRPLSLSIPNNPIHLKSGPVAQGETHNLTLNSDQMIIPIGLKADNISIGLDQNQDPVSQLQMTQAGIDNLPFSVTVVDGDQKGQFNWNVSAFNLALIETTNVTRPEYFIRGFTERKISADPRELSAGLANLMVGVGNPLNINMENLSKEGPGPNNGTVFQYMAITPGTQLGFNFDHVNKFTICDSNGLTDPQGDFIFNLDALSRAGNASIDSFAEYIVRED